jgi:hypothetical protein
MHYFKSDFADATDVQCVASTFYIYLVSICSLVAFGGLLGKNTKDEMVREIN